MAATQAESQQNDVKLNESVKCAQKRTQVGGNSASASAKQQLDSEPDDKVSRGAAQLLKYVSRGGDTTGYEMSQYREDIGGHTAAGEVKSPREAGQTSQEPVGKQEAHDAPGHPGHPGHPFAPNVIRDYSDEYSNNKSGDQFAPTKSSLAVDYPPGKQLPEYVAKHADFPGKQLDYHGKHLMHESDRTHRAEMEEHYSPSKIETRLYVGATSGNFSGQPRFLSGQGMSQTAGPTPTLNQLLQASTPVHRFHGNYPGMGPEYQQPWPMQRPPVVPPVYPQPSQRPPQTGSPRLHTGPGAQSSPTPMQYQQYTQRYSSPTRPHAPYSHHQLNSYTTQTSHPSSLYTEQRGWNQGGPPNPPPPPSNQVTPSGQSPQRALSQSPAPPPAASPQPQATSQTQAFHNIQQRATTPNTQGIDSGELSGQNSNDSSNGPACPGTPNSQGMRPTPSPTGSTGSRSMSPAVGQQNVQMPPRPSSSQSDSSGPAPRMSHSPMTTQGAYQQPLGPSPHMHSYKMNSTGPGVVQPGPGSTALGGISPMGGGMGYAAGGTAAGQPGGYHAQSTYPPPRPHMQFPQGYPTPANSQPPPNNQYQPPNRPNNLVQYPPYTHKMGFNSVPPGMPPSPGPPQVYGAGGATAMVPPGAPGVPVIGNMGPPASSMGPPPPSPNHISNQPPPPTSSAVPHLHTPAATPPLNHEGSPMPPPSTTPNSHPASAPTPTSHNSADLTAETSNDSGITTTASGTSAINVISTSSGTVTSVITTGPDGTSLDEGSQQSTLSNASAASGEDPAFTPKVRKEMIGGYHSHPATPQSTVPSPGAASINSIHEEYSDMNSPGWPRTPASPVFNSHVPQDPYRSKKTDSLAKLYEMDESLERRSWLDKLVNFMEERRSPITSCPTISKNPLDLFRLYLYVKERGGFMEVCKVTKNKTWKDIAGLLGIGASSSAAYTLRKHYTKHLLAYECHFDRGGVDPQPIINQVEAGSKKKGSKGTASVPSPGSSNSQDSFPAAGSSNASMDGYGNYQGSYAGGTPGGPSSEYTPPPPRPPSQSSAPSAHQGIQQGTYQNTGSYQNYPQEQYIRPQGNAMSQQGEFNQPYSPRSHYPPYVPDVDRGYPSGNMPPNNATGQDMYNRYTSSQQGPASYPTGTPPNARSNSYPSGPQTHPVTVQQQTATSQPSSPSQPPTVSSYSCPQDYYRQEQSGYGAPAGTQIYTASGSANKNMPPPPPGPTQPRRHPDFAKDQQYPQYNQQRPAYPGWPNTTNQYNSNSGNNRVQYPSQPAQSPSQQPQPQPPQQGTQVVTAAPTAPAVNMASNQQWASQPSNRSSSQPSINAIAHPPPPWDHRYTNQPSPLYPTPGNHQTQLGVNPMISQQPTSKREMTFPPDSVEAITPLLYKRRKLTRADVTPVEAWRIMMALRSGLLAESCWALDVLNILLFDDSSVSYFGLTHLPGLLDVLLEHFSRSLSDMFESCVNDDDRYCQAADGPEVDLGAVTRPIDSEDRTKLLSTSNYTYLSRRGRPVKIVPRDDDLFVLDTRRPWDHQECESETEPWQVDTNATKYIVTCFQSEVGSVPFARLLRDEKPPLLQKEVDSTDLKDEAKADSVGGVHETLDFTHKSGELGDKQSNKDSGERKQQQQLDKKKKTKTLSDVLSRIKKEPVEMNDLTRELFEKKNDGFKKDCDSEMTKANNNMGEHFGSDMSKNDEDSLPTQNGLNESVATVSGNIDNTIDKAEIKTETTDEHELLTTRDDREGPRLQIRDPAGTLKRRRISDYEDESYSRDEASLYLVTETQDNLARRCVCLSTILRNLTFIPGNEAEFAKNVTFLSLLGKLLLLHHEHPIRAQKTRNYDREEDADFADSCSSLQGEGEWWWDFLHHVRENVLVMAANISGHMDLSQHPEEISRPVLDGLLHWAVCPAAHGQDPFPTVGPNSSLSPQRLALEALCKLCVTECNVDLVVATPPYSRLQRLCSVLTRLLCRSEEQVLREFGVNLLHFLSAADSGVARTIALQTPCVALLVAFIEQAESSAIGVANQHGLAALRDNPESMGTSLDMLRRAAGTLLNLARHPDNRTLLLQHESRLLALVMSQILDQQVAAIVARVLFQCSRGT